MNKVFIYSNDWAGFSYGTNHPMKPIRLELTYKSIKQAGFFDLPQVSIVKGREALEEEVLSFHTQNYIDALKKADEGVYPDEAWIYGLGHGDNPVFEGVYRWSILSAGASVHAAELVGQGEAEVAFNISGGLHHAMKNRASGFCYINDPVVAINTLLKMNKRVAYLDIDAHHGDGVQSAFYGNEDVLTISIHERGDSLFPGTGWPNEIGEGKGQGLSINLPMPPYSDDTLYLRAFSELIPPVIKSFRPDVIVTQLGVDTLRSDPITHLNLSIDAYGKIIKEIKLFSIPWVALGGGGYDIDGVAKAWTLAWGVMVGEERTTANEERLEVEEFQLPPQKREELWTPIERDIGLLKNLDSKS